jgi:Protein of unknown function (DUF3043)
VRLRRTSADQPEQSAAVETDTADRVNRPAKGRATPKRRDVAPRRQPVSAPKTNKEATQWRKQQASQAKPNSITGPKMTNAELRAARMRGDESALPRKDRGPIRRYTRDWVDTHRMASNYLLILFPLYIVALRFPYLSAAVAGILIILLIECYFAGMRVRKLVIARFGECRESALALAFYILGRAYLPRRMRVPKPHLSVGDSIE